VLTDDELRVILADPQDAFRFTRTAHAAMILLLTGQRRGELAAARWKEIDLRARTWTIPPENSKTGRGHLVPLSAAALEHFAALRRLADGARYVMPDAEGKGPIEAKLLTRSIARCLPRLKKLGVKPFTLHDLRRTCRTGLARLGVRPDIAERVLNHAVGGVAGVYDVHSYQDEKRDALDRWAAHLAALVVNA
jgi:integrase